MRKESNMFRNTSPRIMESPFEILVEHYCFKILPKMRLAAEGRENFSFNGLTLLYDGDRIFAIGPQMVNKPNVGFGEKVHIKNKPHFLDYLAKQEDDTGGDRTFFLDTVDSDIMPYKGGLKNHMDGINMEQILFDHLPKDFLSENGSQYDVGCRVEIAAFIPVAYKGIKSIILQQTGHGKLSHFDEQGLIEEFSLLPDAASGGPFIDESNKIVGVYKSYRMDGRPYRNNNGVLIPCRNEIVDEHLQKPSPRYDFKPPLLPERRIDRGRETPAIII